MATMDLTHAQAAREDALKDRLTEQQARWLAEKLADSDVRGHSVAYDPGKWRDLPPSLGSGTSITRGDIFGLADSPAIDVFTASYLFGMGTRGYGPSRYDKIRAGAPRLGETLDRVREIGRCQGPIFAYAQLYGGRDHEHRTRPGTEPWSRVDAYGPAFFTKFLYFTVPGALILDARLAGRVARLTGNSYGYLTRGQPVAWTPYRYAIYLHWMRQAAADVSRHTAFPMVSSEQIELTLFKLSLSELPQRSGSSDVSPDQNDDGEAAD